MCNLPLKPTSNTSLSVFRRGLAMNSAAPGMARALAMLSKIRDGSCSSDGARAVTGLQVGEYRKVFYFPMQRCVTPAATSPSTGCASGRKRCAAQCHPLLGQQRIKGGGISAPTLRMRSSIALLLWQLPAHHVEVCRIHMKTRAGARWLGDAACIASSATPARRCPSVLERMQHKLILNIDNFL